MGRLTGAPFLLCSIAAQLAAMTHRHALSAAALLTLALVACNRAPSQPTWQPDGPARAAVLAGLRDPESARFGPLTPGKGAAWCGTVNARNGYGGMTGPRAFAWSPSTGVMLYEFDGPLGRWIERGEVAERFAALGCSVGPDQERALAVARDPELHPSEK